MSLSDDLRNELAAIAPRRRCDAIAELSGLFHGAGSMHLRGRGKVDLHLDVASAAVARRAFRLLRELGIESEIRTYRRRALEQGTRYQLRIAGQAQTLALVREAGVLGRRLEPLERPPRRVVGRSCCRSAYLRGALLAAGSLSGPRGRHLKIRAAALEGARFTASVAAASGATLGVLDRGRHAVAYAKGAETIAHLLALAGASDTLLALEERGVVGATRSRANRLANADHANLVRTSRAAHVQLRAVRRLAEADALAELEAPLREAAELRLRHPSLSLRELAVKCRPPATKAALHRRLAKLVRLSEL